MRKKKFKKKTQNKKETAENRQGDWQAALGGALTLGVVEILRPKTSLLLTWPCRHIRDRLSASDRESEGERER